MVPPAGYKLEVPVMIPDTPNKKALTVTDSEGVDYYIAKRITFGPDGKAPGALYENSNFEYTNYLSRYNYIEVLSLDNTVLQPELISWLEAQGFTIPK